MPRNTTLKYPGGQTYKAKRIVEFMPPHLHYAEPYFGGGAVLFERDPDDKKLWIPGHKGVSEIVNDIDRELTNFWSVLAGPGTFAEFKRYVEAIPLSRVEWDDAHAAVEFSYRHPNGDGGPSVRRAADFFVNNRQSHSGFGDTFTSPTRTRTRRNMNGNVSEWIGSVEGLDWVHARLRRVMIENMDAIKFIKREDTKNTFFYLDPTYLVEDIDGTPIVATKNLYRYMMDINQHKELLRTLAHIDGKFLLSGYFSKLYDRAASDAGWSRFDFDYVNNMAGGSTKRVMRECLWMNY